MKILTQFQVGFCLFTISSVHSATESETLKVSPISSKNQLNQWCRTHPNETQPTSTNQGGVPIPSMVASQAIGSRGHILLQDAFLLDKTASFNRERIPERVVHAKGAGAKGTFIVTHDISKYTKAFFLNGIGKKTPVVVRFSTVGGELGSADTWIDPKGFAVRFKTEQGNHDLVGNNIEVFPIRDPMLFADINRSRKRNPQTHLRDPNPFWDFVTLRPETTLHTLHLFSDEGTPMGFRRMDGAGVHTYKMVNSEKEAVYVKFHWKCNQEKKIFTKEESVEMAGRNADFAIQDLYDAIAAKDFPSWDLSIQVMTFPQAVKHRQNPFDITKHWRREQYPLIPVGKMTLNENHKDYFTGVESVAFSPSNMVTGIEPSPDRMLHARMFSYPDAQRYRLGANFNQLPVNMPVSPVTTYVRDGSGCHGLNGEGGPNYFPNSYHGVRQNPDAQQSKFPVSGDIDRLDTGDDDNFSQARVYLKKDIRPAEKQRLVDNLADFLSKADKPVQDRFVSNIAFGISDDFGKLVEEALTKASRKSK